MIMKKLESDSLSFSPSSFRILVKCGYLLPCPLPQKKEREKTQPELYLNVRGRAG